MFFFIFIDEEKESQGRGQRLEVSAVNVSQVIMTLRADTLGVMTPLNSNILAISIKLTLLAQLKYGKSAMDAIKSM